MNEETNTPETLAAVLAEMREWSTDENDALDRYADRIEAAAERERAITYAMLAAKDKPLPHPDPEHAPPLFAAPGDAAALREALDKAECVLLVAARFATDDAFDDADARENLRDVDWDGALAEIRAALAAPSRNCDRFEDADAARDAVKDEFANMMALDDRQLRAVCDWLFDPAQEGGAK